MHVRKPTLTRSGQVYSVSRLPGALDQELKKGALKGVLVGVRMLNLPQIPHQR